MTPAGRQKLIEQIHASGRQFVLSITGGGSGALAALLQVPGASASVLEAVVPYSAPALQQWLGGPVDQYCSAKTARAIAMRAFERAGELSAAQPSTLCGIGATASLATSRPKRGPHRVHVAWQSFNVTAVTSCLLPKDRHTRAEEEDIATQLILHAVAEACGLSAPDLIDASSFSQIAHQEQRAPNSWTELLLGARASVTIPSDRAPQEASPGGNKAITPLIVFPGAFNPLHAGHERMAEIAAARYRGPVTFELSIINVDKPPLDFIEIANRLEQLGGRCVLLTRAPTFVEKACLTPGCIFIVGIDTLVRIADPRYYGGDLAMRDAAVAEIAKRGCRFLVFGRAMDGQFAPLSAAPIPSPLRSLCDEVPEAEFRTDISSSALREREPDK